MAEDEFDLNELGDGYLGRKYWHATLAAYPGCVAIICSRCDTRIVVEVHKRNPTTPADAAWVRGITAFRKLDLVLKGTKS